MNRRFRTALAAIVLAAAAAALAGCGGGHEAAKPDDRPPVTVPLLVVRSDAGAGTVVLPGRVEAREEVTLSSRIAGRLTSLPVAGGSAFREGDVLARFDAPEAREALAAAEAAWGAAKARLDVARRQEERFDSLYTAKVAALHELEVVRAERQSAEAAERGAAAAVSERRSAVEVRAPFAGVVVRRRVDPGAEVGPGTPLLDIRSRESGLVVASVPEREDGRLRAGVFAIQIGDGPWRDAALARADGMVDPVSRTRAARFRPKVGGGLEAGAFARVRLGGVSDAPAAKRATPPRAAEATVPSAALVRRGSLSGVYVVREGRARLRWLRLGGTAGADVVVLAGLDPGDSVALAPAELTDGRRVEAAR
jgi:RND family efflux transporter MFP subunit